MYAPVAREPSRDRHRTWWLPLGSVLPPLLLVGRLFRRQLSQALARVGYFE